MFVFGYLWHVQFPRELAHGKLTGKCSQEQHLRQKSKSRSGPRGGWIGIQSAQRPSWSLRELCSRRGSSEAFWIGARGQGLYGFWIHQWLNTAAPEKRARLWPSHLVSEDYYLVVGRTQLLCKWLFNCRDCFWWSDWLNRECCLFSPLNVSF